MTGLHQFFSSATEAEHIAVQIHIPFYVPNLEREHMIKIFCYFVVIEKGMFIIF